MTRVAIVSDAVLPWHPGGKELRWYHLTRELAALGMDVEVHTMRWFDEVPAGSVRYRAICPLQPMYREDGRRSMRQALVFAVSCLRLIGVRADVIDADQMPGLQLVPLWIVSRLRRIPLVVTWHEMWGSAGWRQYLGRAGVIAAFVERLGTRCADRIVSISDATTAALLAAGVPAHKIETIPSGVDVGGRVRRCSSDGALRLVVVGRLVDHKRVDVVIDAVRILVDAGHAVQCTVIGDGPERSRLEEHCRAQSLGSHVVFTGSIEDHADVLDHIAASDVFVAPSEREGYGIAVTEALAAGVPVVVSDHPENASRHLVADGCGAVVAAGDASAFAEAITTVVAYDDVAAWFQSAHPALTWRHAATAYARLYERLRGERKRKTPVVAW